MSDSRQPHSRGQRRLLSLLAAVFSLLLRSHVQLCSPHAAARVRRALCAARRVTNLTCTLKSDSVTNSHLQRDRSQRLLHSTPRPLVIHSLVIHSTHWRLCHAHAMQPPQCGVPGRQRPADVCCFTSFQGTFTGYWVLGTGYTGRLPHQQKTIRSDGKIKAVSRRRGILP